MHWKAEILFRKMEQNSISVTEQKRERGINAGNLTQEAISALLKCLLILPASWRILFYVVIDHE